MSFSIYLWLCWVCTAACGPFLAAAEVGAALRLHVSFSHGDFSYCGSRALEHGHQSCGTRRPLPCSMESFWTRDWTHMSCGSCIAGRFFTTETPGKPLSLFIHNQFTSERQSIGIPAHHSRGNVFSAITQILMSYQNSSVLILLWWSCCTWH